MTQEALEDPKWTEDEPELSGFEIALLRLIQKQRPATPYGTVLGHIAWLFRCHTEQVRASVEFLCGNGYVGVKWDLTTKARAALAADRERRKQVKPSDEWRTDFAHVPYCERVMVWTPTCVCFAYHDGLGQWWDRGHVLIDKPTHWRPVPKGPVTP